MGYTTMGAAFGILLNRIGYGPWWALFMCVTILSGSLQFAAVGLIAGSMSLAETAVMSLLINIRYSVYGLALQQIKTQLAFDLIKAGIRN